MRLRIYRDNEGRIQFDGRLWWLIVGLPWAIGIVSIVGWFA